MKGSVNVLLLGLALADNMYVIGRIFINGICACARFHELRYQYENFYQPFMFIVVLVCMLLGEFD